jgi:hypothetical protein
MVMMPEPCPDSGEATSQFPLFEVEMLTVQVRGAEVPGGLVNCAAWLGGLKPPAWPVKLSADGVNVTPEASCSVTLAVAVFPPTSLTVNVPL